MNQPSIYEIIQKVRHNIDKPFKDLNEATESICIHFDELWMAIEKEQDKDKARNMIIKLSADLVKLHRGLDELISQT